MTMRGEFATIIAYNTTHTKPLQCRKTYSTTKIAQRPVARDESLCTLPAHKHYLYRIETKFLGVVLITVAFHRVAETARKSTRGGIV